jgi:LAO/AO transport system kinase
MRSVTPSLEQYIQGLSKGDKVILGRAITLVESQLEEDRHFASQLIQQILPKTGQSIRIGISGVPGVGKSTFIEALGMLLTARQKKVAVLAVDPSSSKTKGSILGDKTRMEELSKNPLALIRPTPAGGQLGGVAGRTRETILLCEAAGFEIILVETVGVGQSETAVHSMTDFFLLLMLAGAGDELQGIKKGIMEMSDAIVINKADGENVARVQQTQADLQHALHYMSASEWGWATRVLTCSALMKKGIEEIWSLIESYQQTAQQKGAFQQNRLHQNKKWMEESLHDLIQQKLLTVTDRHVKQELEMRIRNQDLYPPEAARILFNELMSRWK